VRVTDAQVRSVISALYRSHGPEGRIATVWPTGSMVLWIAILLGVTLIVNFVS
jgi:multicomponent Na+:H+ antiporter subunit D